MTLNDISNLRLTSQQIANPQIKSAKEIVNWMVAMQAQDFNMTKWAIALRLNKATEENIYAVINSGEIIRTHVLRPTWHFVSAENIIWMLELTAPRLKASMRGRLNQLELTEKVLRKCNKIIELLLSSAGHATRKELVSELNKAKIATDENRSSHILMNAELDKIICSGGMKGKQTTYALLEEWVKAPKHLSKEESLFTLATKYFESHGPATLHDFVWWSGLSVSDAKIALELIKDEFVSERIDAADYWFPNSFSVSKKFKESIFLLPAFDEFLISYKDRTAAIATEHHGKAFSNNGIFCPTIVVNGQVAGLWKREIKKDILIIEAGFFDKKSNVSKSDLQKASNKLGNFLGLKTELVLK